MQYTDLCLNKTGFAKISKSSRSISNKCVEPFYTDYRRLIVKDDDPCGHGMLSFVPLDCVVLCLSYGDTFTEIETSKLMSGMFCPNIEVNVINNAFAEHLAQQLIVKRNVSLNDLGIQRYIIEHAAPEYLAIAANPLFESMKLSRHFGDLKMNEASKLWKELEDSFKEASKKLCRL